jgi:acyl carrier protein
MNEAEIRDIIVAELDNIAPGSGADSIGPKADIRSALDIDSMDFLNFVTALHARLKIDIPEADYPKLFTIVGAVGYLKSKVPA